MLIYGIDPGPEKSAYVVWDGKQIYAKEYVPNELMLIDIRAQFYGKPGVTIYAVEGVEGFGKIVGKSIFQTCYHIGRIQEAAACPVEVVSRKAIKIFLTGTVRSKDKDIRRALIDKLGEEVTRGISNHLWSALAVAVYFYESRMEALLLASRRLDS